MAFRTRLSVADILHRGLVWSLFGITVWGSVMIGVVHRNTMAAGRGAYCAPSRVLFAYILAQLIARIYAVLRGEKMIETF